MLFWKYLHEEVVYLVNKSLVEKQKYAQDFIRELNKLVESNPPLTVKPYYDLIKEDDLEVEILRNKGVTNKCSILVIVVGKPTSACTLCFSGEKINLAFSTGYYRGNTKFEVTI